MGKFGDEKKVYQFLKGLNSYEFLLLGHHIDFARQVQHVIKTYNVPKAEFCLRMDIKLSQYDNFYKGSFNYDLMRMVKLSNLWKEKEIEEVHKKKHFKVGTEIEEKS